MDSFKDVIVIKGGVSYNLRKVFGLYVVRVPFLIFPTPREVFKREWLDRDGVDEYLPEKVTYESYDMTIPFVYVGAVGTAHSRLSAFIGVIAGGYFELRDGYTGTVRKGVRYLGLDGSPSFRSRSSGGDLVEFSLRFVVTQPMGHLSSNKKSEGESGG